MIKNDEMDFKTLRHRDRIFCSQLYFDLIDMPKGKGAIVLAGGRSSRLGKIDKAFLDMTGKMLIQHVVSRISFLSPNIVVVFQKPFDENRFKTMPLSNVSFTKDVHEGKGPLAGIISGLRNLQTEYFVLTPCDTPFINMDVIEFLFQEARQYDAAIPMRSNGYLEPLQAVYKSDITLKAAWDAIEHDELSIFDMIRRLGKVNYVAVDKIKRRTLDIDTFFNINTYSDLEEARKRSSKKK